MEAEEWTVAETGLLAPGSVMTQCRCGAFLMSGFDEPMELVEFARHPVTKEQKVILGPHECDLQP